MRRGLVLFLTAFALVTVAPAAQAALPKITSFTVSGCGDGSVTASLSVPGRVMTLAVMQRPAAANSLSLPSIIGPRLLSLPAGSTTFPFSRIAGRPLSAFPQAIHTLFVAPVDGLRVGRVFVIPVGNICAP